MCHPNFSVGARRGEKWPRLGIGEPWLALVNLGVAGRVLWLRAGFGQGLTMVWPIDCFLGPTRGRRRAAPIPSRRKSLSRADSVQIEPTRTSLIFSERVTRSDSIRLDPFLFPAPRTDGNTHARVSYALRSAHTWRATPRL